MVNKVMRPSNPALFFSRSERNQIVFAIRKAEQNPAGRPAVVQELTSRLSGGSAWFEAGAK